MPGRKPALGREALTLKLTQANISPQDIRVILRNEGFMAITTRNAQMANLKDLAWNLCQVSISPGDLAEIYEITEHHVRQILWKYAKKPDAHLGRPFSLTEDQEKQVIEEIKRRTFDEMYFTQAELLRWVISTMRVSLSQGWFVNFLKRYANEICIETVDPQEEPRLQVPRIWITRYWDLITKILPLAKLDLIFNLDETGLSEWEDRRSCEVVVPAAYKGMKLTYPVSRKVRHQTLTCLVNAAGDAYCPLLIAPTDKAAEIFEKLPHQERCGHKY
jgi:hypothetical protein